MTEAITLAECAEMMRSSLTGSDEECIIMIGRTDYFNSIECVRIQGNPSVFKNVVDAQDYIDAWDLRKAHPDLKIVRLVSAE